MSEKIRVHVRVRNMTVEEKDNELQQKWFIKDNLLHQKLDDERSLSYLCYESVFFEEDNQTIFNKCIEKNVDSLFEGKSLTVFAYGQTGSGKTYTMTGQKDDPGIIRQVLSHIFQRTDSFSEGQISYFEIYNENIIDLINPENKPRIFSYNDQVTVKGLDRVKINNLESANDLIEDCEKRRKVGQTQFNIRSSRSHTIFKFEMKIKKTVVSVTLIDLAGSEKASGSALRVKEGVFINKSLLALGKVMSSIHKKEFASYRDSKLTRVLQSSMTGNVNLVALCMISPNISCVDESVSTLKFASRLCQIEMKYQIKNNDTMEEKDYICVNCKNNFNIEKKKLTVSEYSDSSTDSLSNSASELELFEKYTKLQEKRIANLESLIISLFKKTPSLKEKEIFTLEKNMYNLQIDILKRKKSDQI
ncbi:Kinesin-like protein [Pseudoloma neurophilia]|uniref:Kinesin-like protein n=1 Tax=Pseudoloma neurophilia TaxID=146866 RepID=A0A0R0LT56_9MICR|nr:Kinesin-like protein [Pseudoloma neurophilia]